MGGGGEIELRELLANLDLSAYAEALIVREGFYDVDMIKTLPVQQVGVEIRTKMGGGEG